jgi:hypothetical protein
VAALLALLAAGVKGVLQRPAKAPPPALLAVAWIVGYSMLGGGNQVVGLSGFVWLRATNRYSIWILAVVLLYAVTRSARVWARTTPATRAAVAALVAAVALADQVPAPTPRVAIRELRRQVEGDRLFASALSSALPAGSMVFMLPVTEFPEGRVAGPGSGYEHLRPYLFSSGLRFSFGTDKGRPREAWQKRVAGLPAASMADALEGYGFSGLVVNRRAYPEGASGLLNELAGSGRPAFFGDASGEYVFVRLNPRPVDRSRPAAALVSSISPADRVEARASLPGF